MSKKEKEEKDDSTSWTFNGNECEWDGFDRRISRWMRKKFDSVGEMIWNGETPDIEYMSDDDLLIWCTSVLEAIKLDNVVLAKSLKKSKEFLTREWQMTWLKRQATLLVDYIEEHARGQAELEIINYTGSKLEIRKHLYKQFGAGSAGDIHDKELEFEKGMPENGNKAFPKGCDIIVKLRQLEARRLYFYKMCEPSKRNSYIYCQESKLVRIVLEHVGQDPDYKDCVSRVLDLVKVKKMIEGSTKKSKRKSSLNLNSVPDMHERSFSDDWLPSWMLLSSSLINEYKKLVKDKGPSKTSNGKGGTLPVALVGVKPVTCYGCGGAHKKGDPGCTA